MRSISILALAGVVSLGLLGCGKSSKEDSKPTGPVTVSFGDCAGPNAYFESGPRPIPFDVEAVDLSAPMDVSPPVRPGPRRAEAGAMAS